ncbi:MAG: c-type cytochrome [Acidobacteriota bacterium]|nr:c-type cytochrome [Acidobacteriota bacterium]
MKHKVLYIVLVASVAFAQTAQPPQKPADSKEPTAAQEFKNVQVLKDVPAKEWWSTMAFIAGSLGVGCEHCHVNPFAKDEKPAKARAREMMKMVQAINAQNFSEQQNRVTCMTCHNGSTKPARTPTIAQAGWLKEFLAASTERPAAPPATPDAQLVIAKYRAAIGVANAASVRSRYYKGTVTFYNGSAQGPRTVEQVIYIAGEQLRVDITSPQGTQSNIYDGRRGWVITAKETHEMNPDEIANIRARIVSVLQIDALPQFTAANLKGAEEIRGHQTWAVELTTADNKTATCFFDQQSGLLVVRRGANQSAFGKFSDETWFDDYRDFGGVKLPLTVISAAVSNGTVRRYEEVQINLPIEPKRFQPPAAGTGTGD